MSAFTIRPYAYTDEDAAKLAVMWNASDDQWPGTFTDGVPMTTERVREWLDRETGLSMLVVDDPDQERIVGYGSLWEEHDREKTCYVALLNVQPDYQGKSLARRMLTRMVDQAAEMGYELMTIGTWSGNLKSVPLYKKVGFFWAPDTGVFMENFVPLIRQLPMAQRYFEKHDWYTSFKRELLQVEDDERHGGMRVYHYRWEKDGDYLMALIDREAKALTGLETNDLAVYSELDEVEPAHGLPYPIRWRVINKRDQPVNVSILASGAPGVQISHQSAFLLEGGQERTVEGQFTVSSDIKPVKKDWPAPRLKTVLVVGGPSTGSGQAAVIELGTGVRPRPAIRVSTEPVYPLLLPGQPQTIHVQLRNNLDRPLEGVVSLAPQPGLQTDWPGLRHAFSLDAKGFAGLPLTVTCGEPGGVTLRFSAAFEVDGDQVGTRPEHVPLLSLPPGGLAAHIGPRGDEERVILVENEFFRLECRSEGGSSVVWDKATERRAMSIGEELGPPFVPSELWHKSYDLALERGGGWVKALSRARSNNFPGLTFTKVITLSASSLMTVRYRLTNEGTQAHTVHLNSRIWLADNEKAQLTLPRADRLVQEHSALFSRVHGDMPEEPERMAERWLAWRVDDLNLGLIWGDEIEKHQWHWGTVRLNRPELTLEPGTSIETPPLHLYAGPGDWAEVRRSWARLTCASLPERTPRPERRLEFGFDPSPILSLSDQMDVTLRADSVRELALDGELVFAPPAGWRAEPTEFQLEEIKHEQPLVATVRLEAQEKKIGAFTGELHLKSTRFDASEHVTLIHLGDESVPVQVKEITGGDQPLFVIDNGHSRWQIAPAYHAGVVGWYVGTSDTNHLYSGFPQEDGAQLGWLKPWFGGIRPYLPIPLERWWEGWPGKLHEEQFSAKTCERVDQRGFIWSGVRLRADLEREEFQGLRAEIEYLTVGRSNLLKVVYRLVNETGVYRNSGSRHEPGVQVFCQVDGRHDNGTLNGDGVQRKRTPTEMWARVGDWSAVTNPQSGRTLVLVRGSAQTSLELSDWGQDGGHLIAYRDFVLPPYGQDEIVLYLALTDSLDEARRYAALTT